MITEALITILAQPFMLLLDLLPEVDLNMAMTAQRAADSFMDYLLVAKYFFPVGTAAAIFSLNVIFRIIRILMSLLNAILNLLPFF